MERRVLVTFKENAELTALERFYEGLYLLRDHAEGLVHFEVHRFSALPGEQHLSNVVSNVIFPDVMSVWRFNTMELLESFITSPFHLDIARTRFQPVVKQRIVFNCVS